MTSQQSPDLPDTDPSDASIAEHLDAHPDFFDRHPELLSRLRLRHARGGGTISLVERQVTVLRDRNGELEGRMRELVDLARRNHELSDGVHRLAVRLMAAGRLPEVLATTEASLREDFGAQRASVILLHEASEIVQDADTHFLRRMHRGDPALKPFATFFESGAPRCGQIRDAQREVLFPDHGVDVGSTALVPLGGDPVLGILAIGNGSADHFHPGMSTDFLTRIGELLTAALEASAT